MWSETASFEGVAASLSHGSRVENSVSRSGEIQMNALTAAEGHRAMNSGPLQEQAGVADDGLALAPYAAKEWPPQEALA